MIQRWLICFGCFIMAYELTMIRIAVETLAELKMGFMP